MTNYHALKQLNPKYADPFGNWYVTSPSFYSGSAHLVHGVFNGYIDEIVFHLAGSARDLEFKKVDSLAAEFFGPYDYYGADVEILLDVESGTWEMEQEKRVAELREAYKSRNIDIKPGHKYARVIFSKH